MASKYQQSVLMLTENPPKIESLLSNNFTKLHP